MPFFCAAYAAPNKGTTILYWFRSPKTVWNPPVNGKIQALSKDLEFFSSPFQGKFNFQELFKTALYIQVLFKPVRALHSFNGSNLLQFSIGSPLMYEMYYYKFWPLESAIFKISGDDRTNLKNSLGTTDSIKLKESSRYLYKYQLY